MRYYRIQILTPNGDVVKEWSSVDANGNNLKGALNVEIDSLVYDFAIPDGSTHVTIYGISLQDIGQAGNWNDQTMLVEAGMTAGLPLANADQKGIIVYGMIQQAIGNWQGQQLSLDFFVVPGSGGTGSVTSPRNFTFNWKAGTNLGEAITSTLYTAFQNSDYASPLVNINPNLLLPQDENAYFRTLAEFAIYLKRMTKSIANVNKYTGLTVLVDQKRIRVFDSSQAENTKTIKFQDLIGQPAWQDVATINFKTVIRCDLSVGDYVQLPTVLATTTANSYSRYRDTSVMQNIYQIIRIRHVGNFRQPDGNSWCSIFNAQQVAGENAPT